MCAVAWQLVLDTQYGRMEVPFSPRQRTWEKVAAREQSRMRGLSGRGLTPRRYNKIEPLIRLHLACSHLLPSPHC